MQKVPFSMVMVMVLVRAPPFLSLSIAFFNPWSFDCFCGVNVSMLVPGKNGVSSAMPHDPYEIMKFGLLSYNLEIIIGWRYLTRFLLLYTLINGGDRFASCQWKCKDAMEILKGLIMEISIDLYGRNSC